MTGSAHALAPALVALDRMAVALLVLGALPGLARAHRDGARRAALPGLAVLAGATLLATADDLLVAAVATTILRATRRGSAGAALSTVLALLGLAFAVAASGGTSLDALAAAFTRGNPEDATFAALALALTLASLGALARVVPFHGLEGADADPAEGTPGERALAVAVTRIAALLFALRVLLGALPAARESWQTPLWALAVATLTLGAWTAWRACDRRALVDGAARWRSGLVLAALALADHDGAVAVLLIVAVDAPVLALLETAGERASRLATALLAANACGVPATAGGLGALCVALAALDADAPRLATLVAASNVVLLAAWLRTLARTRAAAPAEASAPGSRGLGLAALAVGGLACALGVVPAPLVELVRGVALPLP